MSGAPTCHHVLVGHDRTPITNGVDPATVQLIDATDSWSATTASVVASPPRAWFDCARDVDDERFERLTEWVLDHTP